MENDLGPPGEDAMMTSEKRIEIGTWPSYHYHSGSNHLPSHVVCLLQSIVDDLGTPLT
jgi:hypothetical protein